LLRKDIYSVVVHLLMYVFV